MKALADKAMLLGGTLVCVLVAGEPGAATICWLLAGVTVSGLCGALEDRPDSRWWPLGYLAAGLLSPASVHGAPLICYDLARAVVLDAGPGRRLAGVGGVLLAGCLLRWLENPTQAGFGVVLCGLGVALGVRTAQAESVRGTLYAVRDDLAAQVSALELTNARLLEAQEHETRSVALGERTRIAREMHDGVGHQLTRLLFQVSALQITHRGDPGLEAEFKDLGEDLTESLEAMRRSVHALSDEGEDLASSLHTLGSRCGIAEVSVDCALDASPPPPISRCILAVVREALTNAVRHGRAGSARVVVNDYPAFWRVRVDNDGLVPEESADHRRPLVSPGLGLRSMTERVEALGGTMWITPRPRFTVFATIPKEAA